MNSMVLKNRQYFSLLKRFSSWLTTASAPFHNCKLTNCSLKKKLEKIWIGLPTFLLSLKLTQSIHLLSYDLKNSLIVSVSVKLFE